MSRKVLLCATLLAVTASAGQDVPHEVAELLFRKQKGRQLYRPFCLAESDYPAITEKRKQKTQFILQRTETLVLLKDLNAIQACAE